MFNTIKRWLRERFSRPMKKSDALPFDAEADIRAILAVPYHFDEPGFGSKLEYKDGAAAWTEIAQVDGDSLEFPEETIAQAEFKALRTTRHTQRAPGSADQGPMSFIVMWTLAVQTALLALRYQTDIQWRITHADGTSTGTFTGNISTYGKTFRRDEFTVQRLTVAVNGDVTHST